MIKYLIIYILKRINYHKYLNNIEPIIIEPVLQQEEVPNFPVQEVNDNSEIIEEDLENQNWEEEDLENQNWEEGYVNNGYSNNCYDNNEWHIDYSVNAYNTEYL